MRPRRLDALPFLLPVAGILVSSVLLTLGEDGGPAWARLLGAIVLGATGIHFGYQFGRLAGYTQAMRSETDWRRSEAETGVLVAAIRLAGGLAKADVVGWGGPLTHDEKQLIEAVAMLGMHARDIEA